MKQLVFTLHGQDPTHIKTAAERRPHCQRSKPNTLAHQDLTQLDQRHAAPSNLPIDTPQTEAEPNDNLSDQIEMLQLERLARALLSKDHNDLAALATSNPALIEEWQQAFRAQRFAAERSARYWASAAAVLATVKGFGVRSRDDAQSTH